MYIHIIAFIGIVGLNIIILGLVIYWYRNKMLSQYNSFLNKADEILGGKQIDMRYDESLDSAISERLNRIVEISNMHGGRRQILFNEGGKVELALTLNEKEKKMKV